MLKNVIGYVIHESNNALQDVVVVKKTRDTVVFRAIIQDFARNRNRRIYARELLFNALNAPHIKELIEKRAWYGELDHPDDDDIGRQSKVVRANASHLIIALEFFDDRIEAIIETSMYPAGIALRDEILNGHQAAFSLRALGNIIKTSEGVTVTNPFKVITYDNVILPSHQKAYQTEILSGMQDAKLNEGSNFSLNEGYTFGFTSDDFKKLYNISENVQLVSEQFDSIMRADSKVIINENEIIISTDEMKVKMLLEEHLVRGNSYRKFLSSLRK